MAELIGNPIWQPVIGIATEKLNKNNWMEQYVGMIALGSILGGPDPNMIYNEMEPVYPAIFQMFNSEVQRVRYVTGWVIQMIAKYVPNLIFKSQENLETLINAGCTHLQ